MLVVKLHAAAEAGEQQHARQAAEQLTALGFGGEAGHLVAALEQRAGLAALALRAAAASGTADDYQAAGTEAARYSDLGTVLQEAAGVFEARVAAAEQAVNVAVEGRQARRWP